MNKETIIDGVDINRCCWCDFEPDTEPYCRINDGEDLICKANPNCYYKQLKRKEQECEELKEKIKKYSNINEQDTKDFAILHNSVIEIEGLVKNFCEDCSEYERCDYEKDGCYYPIIPRLKDIIKKIKE